MRMLSRDLLVVLAQPSTVAIHCFILSGICTGFAVEGLIDPVDKHGVGWVAGTAVALFGLGLAFLANYVAKKLTRK